MTRLLPLFLAAAILGMVKAQSSTVVSTATATVSITVTIPPSGPSASQNLPTTTEPVADAVRAGIPDVVDHCSGKSNRCDPEKLALEGTVSSTDIDDVCELVRNFTDCMNPKCDHTDEFDNAVKSIEAPCVKDKKDSGSDFLRPTFLVILLLVALLNLV